MSDSIAILRLSSRGIGRSARQHQRIRLDPDRPKFTDGVLRRLGLQLLGGSDEGHQCAVHVADVLSADVIADLTNGLEEWQTLDVADGPADLGDDHVDLVGQLEDALLDLIGDVRDDLDGLTHVVAPCAPSR